MYRVTFLGNDGKLHRVTVEAFGMISAIETAIVQADSESWANGSWLEKCEYVH